MPGSLSTYWKKRDFRITSEPRGEVARPGKRLAFVIQKHAATRLHYDFRLTREPELQEVDIKITHPDRVIDPESKATKLDLVRYYERVAPHMLPHLVGRPIALVRAPTGIGGELFFQKHGEKIGIPGIRQLDRSYWPGHPAMLEVATKETLVGAAQMK